MKRIQVCSFVVTAVLILFASFAFAVDFAPSPMRLSADDVIQYAFDGSALEVPFTMTGTSDALVRFMVYTKDKADEIIDIRNGHLGWHYMNKIDTCIYMSGDYQFITGSNYVTWDGKDNDGGIVPPGEYTYYFWAFNNQSPRLLADPNTQQYINQDGFFVVDEQGMALPRPIHWGREWRWTLGNDPTDENLSETCDYIFGEGWRHHSRGPDTVLPEDYNIVFPRIFNADAVNGVITKFTWVPNGEAERDFDYGVDIPVLNQYGSIVWDDSYLYATESNYKELDIRTYVHIVDYREAEYIGYIDLSETFASPSDMELYGGLTNGGLSQTTYNKNTGFIMGGTHCCCLRIAFEPMYWFEDEEDTVRWENGNGDYTVWDKNYESDCAVPWACNHLGSCTKSSSNAFTNDQNEMMETCQSFGVISFTACAPGGTGIGVYSYAGEVDQNEKNGTKILDEDTPYDGTYTNNTGDNTGGTWWVARDSIKGVIQSGGVSVEENSPATFTVAQNSPNPFNPTTTIAFSLAEAGNVTVDVFNVAGQKVDTLVDGFTEAGSHSVVWDGSEVSAGVYFYTIKSGDFSKTVKMTLLK